MVEAAGDGDYSGLSAPSSHLLSGSRYITLLASWPTAQFLGKTTRSCDPLTKAASGHVPDGGKGYLAFTLVLEASDTEASFRTETRFRYHPLAGLEIPAARLAPTAGLLSLRAGINPAVRRGRSGCPSARSGPAAPPASRGVLPHRRGWPRACSWCRCRQPRRPA